MPDKRVTELALIDAVTSTDLVMVIDDPGGTAVNKKATVDQVLVNVARTNVSNTFTGDQTVDGDLFVTGEVNPVRFAEQKAKIDLFTGVSPGDPVGSRTVMSQSLVAGLALRHDEALDLGRISVGNYDEQLYQPLLFECETFEVHTGVSPGDRVERLRVHPAGGVTIGTDHTDPGTGVTVQITTAPPSYTNLQLTAPDFPNIGYTASNDPSRQWRFYVNALADNFTIDNITVPGPVVEGTPLVFLTNGDVTVGGTLTAPGLGSTPLNATNLTSGTVPDARLSTNVQMKPLAIGDLPANVATKPIPQSDVTNLTTDLAAKVTGPASSNATSLASYADATGKVLQDAGIASTSLARTNAGNIFTVNQTISRATPILSLIDTAQAANAKRFDIINSALTAKVSAVNDAGTVLFTPLTLDRSGNVTVQGTLTATGGLATTALNATNLTSGTVPAAALTAANLPAHASRHNAGGADALAIDAAAATGSLRTLGTTSTSACAGNDSRLTNSRTPTAHATSHNAGGADALAIDAAAATGSLRTLGTGALQAAAGNDARFTDARTPAAHATTHKSGGSDVIKLDDLAAPTDSTTLNASTTAHGLLPKLSNVTTQFLNGQGGWTVPPAPALPANVALKDAANAFTQDQTLSKVQPAFELHDATKPSGNQRWRVQHNGGLYFSVYNDAGNGEILAALALYVNGNAELFGSLTCYGTISASNYSASISASRLWGRGSAAGAGAMQQISLSGGLSMVGTTLTVQPVLLEMPTRLDELTARVAALEARER